MFRWTCHVLLGSDYKILEDGTPRINKFYYCENVIHRANKKNGYQMGSVNYGKPMYPLHLTDRNVAKCANDIGGNYVILNESGLRGWQPY